MKINTANFNKVIIAVCILITALFCSCSSGSDNDDSKKSDPPKPPENPIPDFDMTGTYTFYENDSSSSGSSKWVFYGDGTYQCTVYYIIKTKTGTWSSKGNDVTISYTASGGGTVSGNEVFTVKENNGSPTYVTLTLKDNSEQVSLLLDSFGLAAKTVNLFNKIENSISIQSHDIIIVGNCYDSDSGGYSRPFIWKDGIRQPLSVPDGAKNSEANSVTVSNGSVYVMGYYYYGDSDNWDASHEKILCMWKNGERQILPLPSDTNYNIYFYANAITASGNSVYIVGYYNNTAHKEIVCLWKDGIKQDLDSGNKDAVAYGITVKNNSVYIVGSYDDGTHSSNTSGVGVPCWWKDGVRQTDLPIGDDEHATAHSIAVSDEGIIYIVGTQGRKGSSGQDNLIWWKNGVRQPDLSGETHSIFNYHCSLALAGNSVIIFGHIYKSDIYYSNYACYWKDGIRTDIGGVLEAQTIVNGSIFVATNGGIYKDGVFIQSNVGIGGIGGIAGKEK